ncbi:ribosomal protein S18-alanine N-acetyltransferase [Marinimicrobium alkaliphilum]|uniref:ribosomal protein S18-alanine N-acetyltransferase n=1 Tax=Marinimicrobium alkaliphilum TaxID=2202654 RepID=UPI000DB91D92|nr:ribosomal protein S18-alanine N-acetyltransferase [Marinimicrobium alkaliphilum]
MASYTLTLSDGTGLKLRPLTRADLFRIESIEAQAHTHPWSVDSYEDCLGGRQQCWVARVGNDVVGCTVFTQSADESELLNLVVAPRWQGKGIGRSLLNFVVTQVAPRAEVLFLEVRVSNQKAITLYSASGFIEVGRRKDYYPAYEGREDALVMMRRLAG